MSGRLYPSLLAFSCGLLVSGAVVADTLTLRAFVWGAAAFTALRCIIEALRESRTKAL